MIRHAFGPRLTIERHRLDNGLEILVVPDRSAPVICYQTWFRIGSRWEVPGKTGIAHLFEHLMFNETERFPQGELDRRMEEAGAETNAATFTDWTYYVDNLPAEALPLVIELEADRMCNLVVREPQVESEREVVANERRETVDDDPDGAITEALYLAAFSEHGYRYPTIGSMEDIQALSLEDCRRFYTTYYAPNNATLVVVGDVDVAECLAQIRARYGDIPAQPIPPEPPRPEPEQTAERTVERAIGVETARLALGYKSPAMADPDHLALTIVNEVLFGGRSARVHRALVEEQEIAAETHGYVGNFRDPSLWDMYLSARAEASVDELLAALDVELDRAISEPISEAERQRAVARIQLGALTQLETAAGKAEQIGFSELVLEDPAATFTRLAAYEATTLTAVREAAERYLDRRRRTLVRVEPSRRGGPC